MAVNTNDVTPLYVNIVGINTVTVPRKNAVVPSNIFVGLKCIMRVGGVTGALYAILLG